MSLFLAIYCDAPHCVATHRNSAELELPEDLRDIGYATLDFADWIESNLAGLEWGKESTGGHLCPECVQREKDEEFMRVCPPAKGAAV